MSDDVKHSKVPDAHDQKPSDQGDKARKNAEKQARLADALRANLRRRKDQVRER